jgi:hypothetical protein
MKNFDYIVGVKDCLDYIVVVEEDDSDCTGMEHLNSDYTEDLNSDCIVDLNFACIGDFYYNEKVVDYNAVEVEVGFGYTVMVVEEAQARFDYSDVWVVVDFEYTADVVVLNFDCIEMGAETVGDIPQRVAG